MDNRDGLEETYKLATCMGYILLKTFLAIVRQLQTGSIRNAVKIIVSKSKKKSAK